MTPRDARFAKRFLVVTPGITIRDRLGVLHPEREDNYYRERDLVPPDLWEALLQAQVEIVNYHAFLPRDAKEIKGVVRQHPQAAARRQARVADAFRETPEHGRRTDPALASGPARARSSCSTTRRTTATRTSCSSIPTRTRTKEDEERNREARVWFRGISRSADAQAGVKTVYDLSATPYYLKGSGYNEGFIFPWVVSDFSLMDAIESGIVKVPRIPVDDDAAGERARLPATCGTTIHPPLPKPSEEGRRHSARQGWVPPETLEGALRSLYRSYEQSYDAYEQELAARASRRR